MYLRMGVTVKENCTPRSLGLNLHQSLHAGPVLLLGLRLNPEPSYPLTFDPGSCWTLRLGPTPYGHFLQAFY